MLFNAELNARLKSANKRDYRLRIYVESMVNIPSSFLNIVHGRSRDAVATIEGKYRGVR